MSNLQSILYSIDKNFRIRCIEEEDLQFLIQLRNHPETNKFLGSNLKLTLDLQQQWFNSIKSSTEKVYYIYEKLEKSFSMEYKWAKLGLVRTHDIDYSNKHMGVGGDILFEHRGQGYALTMYELIFKLAFDELEFNRLWLSVLEYNIRARNLYNKLGFIETGIQRQAVLKDGKYHNYIYMDILKTEIKKIKK